MPCLEHQLVYASPLISPARSYGPPRQRKSGGQRERYPRNYGAHHLRQPELPAELADPVPKLSALFDVEEFVAVTSLAFAKHGSPKLAAALLANPFAHGVR